MLQTQVLLVSWNVGVEGHRQSNAVAGLAQHAGWKAIWNFPHSDLIRLNLRWPSKASDFLQVAYMSVLKGSSSSDDEAEHDGCPNCNVAFNLSTNTPRVLRCGHSICTFCLETALIAGVLELTCSPCNRVTALGTQPLPLCHSLMHMLNNEALRNFASNRLWTNNNFMLLAAACCCW